MSDAVINETMQTLLGTKKDEFMLKPVFQWGMSP